MSMLVWRLPPGTWGLSLAHATMHVRNMWTAAWPIAAVCVNKRGNRSWKPWLLFQVLDELVGVIVRHLGALHKLLDAFALLDLLAGFATFAAAAEHTYVRPQLTEAGGTPSPPLSWTCCASTCICLRV